MNDALLPVPRNSTLFSNSNKLWQKYCRDAYRAVARILLLGGGLNGSGGGQVLKF